MTRIPIDDMAPIACTATGDEITARIQQITRLRDELRSLDRTPTGLLLHFAPSDGLAAHLEQLALDEKGCCRFWGFEVSLADEDLTLAWDGPPGVQAVLDDLDRWFRSDEPLTALSGLL